MKRIYPGVHEPRILLLLCHRGELLIVSRLVPTPDAQGGQIGLFGLAWTLLKMELQAMATRFVAYLRDGWHSWKTGLHCRGGRIWTPFELAISEIFGDGPDAQLSRFKEPRLECCVCGGEVAPDLNNMNNISVSQDSPDLPIHLCRCGWRYARKNTGFAGHDRLCLGETAPNLSDDVV